MYLQSIRLEELIEVAETGVADGLVEGDGLGFGGRVGLGIGGFGVGRHVLVSGEIGCSFDFGVRGGRNCEVVW